MPTILKYKLPLEILMMIDDVLRDDLYYQTNVINGEMNELRTRIMHDLAYHSKIDPLVDEKFWQLDDMLALVNKALARLE